MNAEEWRQVDKVFNEVLDREPGDRARFIEEACAGNASLRKEVEALLSAHERAGSFLDAGAAKAVSSLGPSIAAGTRFGPYEILAEIGAGGMGEVYKAHDARLRRDVAVKVLQRVVSDGAAWERFQREARASSALTHPNICTVYDVGEADGQPYLVMELLEGVTLSDRIGGEPLETGAALAIAVQIAEAIEAAHLKGIIHRDIKPANVMITARGRVKVLDFGLAKQTATGENQDAFTVDSVTFAGTVTGTPPYLSPEVLQGGLADARSDLWAFGVLLYQMLTGRLPFTGASIFEMSSAILKDSPPPLPAGVSAGLNAIVERCLAKRPDDRYQSAGEVRTALEALQTRPAAAKRISRRAWLVGAGAAAVVVAAAGTLLQRLWQTEYFWVNPLPDEPWEPLTDFTDDEHSAAISPDGKFAIYIRDLDGQLDAWFSQIGTGLKPTNVTNGQYKVPMDGRNFRGVGFTSESEEVWFLHSRTARSLPHTAYRAPISGGDPREFLVGLNPVWSPVDKRMAYHLNGNGDPIFIADRHGNSARKIFTGDLGVHCHFPIWSPDGLFIYFVKGIAATEEMDIWRIPVAPAGTTVDDSSIPERITSHNTRITHPDWLDSRTLIYTVMAEDSSEQRLYSIDVERRNPHRLRTDQYLSVAVSNFPQRRLIATRATPVAALHTLEVADRVQTWKDVRPFDALRALNTRVLSPRFARALAAGAPDYLLFLSSKGGRDGLWKLENGTAAVVWDAVEYGIVAPPAISRDGQRICFSFRKKERSGLYVMDSNGGPWRLLADSLDIRGAASWSPDGKSVVVAANRKGEGTRVFHVPIEEGAPAPLVDTISFDPLWSPDGDFILYSEPGTVGPTTTLKAVTPTRKPVSVSAPTVPLYGNPGIAYRFIPDRKAIIALVFNKENSRQCFDSVDLESGETVRLAELELGSRIRNFDVSSDGKQIIFDRVQDNGDIVWMDLPEVS